MQLIQQGEDRRPGVQGSRRSTRRDLYTKSTMFSRDHRRNLIRPHQSYLTCFSAVIQFSVVTEVKTGLQKFSLTNPNLIHSRSSVRSSKTTF